jgi:hypothetical protein
MNRHHFPAPLRGWIYFWLNQLCQQLLENMIHNPACELWLAHRLSDWQQLPIAGQSTYLLAQLHIAPLIAYSKSPWVLPPTTDGSGR